MGDHRNTVAEALENLIRYERAKDSVVRALALWETWIVVASILYLVVRFAPWALNGFRVAPLIPQ